MHKIHDDLYVCRMLESGKELEDRLKSYVINRIVSTLNGSKYEEDNKHVCMRYTQSLAR